MSIATRIARDTALSTAELVETYGFRNRWTAKVYQWCLEGFEGTGFDTDWDTVAEDCRDYVRYVRKVPSARLHGVDFGHIAVVLVADAVAEFDNQLADERAGVYADDADWDA